jgi:hypothetical protein
MVLFVALDIVTRQEKKLALEVVALLVFHGKLPGKQFFGWYVANCT